MPALTPRWRRPAWVVGGLVVVIAGLAVMSMNRPVEVQAAVARDEECALQMAIGDHSSAHHAAPLVLHFGAFACGKQRREGRRITIAG